VTSLVVSLDVGDTKVRASYVDGQGSATRRVVAPTAHHAAVPDQLLRLVEDVAWGEMISGVVIGLPDESIPLGDNSSTLELSRPADGCCNG
jgi:predicted NBD/HSP70 family sugar kinase